ncbi:MAG: protein phosphatase [Pseudonocardiaceae bacterium]|nr:protein phosphatase [Pseudonocardiaceae bacterium]
MVSGWGAVDRGVLRLPSGRLVRGRGLRRPTPDGIVPEFGIYLLNKQPQPVSWEARWVRWPDFRLPTDRGDAQDALYEAWRRCIAVLDGVPAREAVAYVRKHYDPRAVETPSQRSYVARFPAS